MHRPCHNFGYRSAAFAGPYARKSLCRGNMHPWVNPLDAESRKICFDRPEYLSPSGSRRRPVHQKIRAVAAQRGRHFRKAGIGKRYGKVAGHKPESKGRIRRTASQPGAAGYSLFQVPVQGLKPRKIAAEPNHSLPNQVRLRSFGPAFIMKKKPVLPVGRSQHFQRIGTAVKGIKNGIQIVEPVGSPAKYMQAQVDFSVWVAEHAANIPGFDLPTEKNTTGRPAPDPMFLQPATLPNPAYLCSRYPCSACMPAFCFWLPSVRTALVWIALLWMAGCAGNRPMGDRNLAYQYDPGHPIRVRFFTLESATGLDVYMEIGFRKMENLNNHLAIWEKYRLDYRITESYLSGKILAEDSLRPSERVPPGRNPLVLRVSLPDWRRKGLFQLHVRERFSGEESVFDLQLPTSGSRQAGLFLADGQTPVFSPWIGTGDTVQILTRLPADSALRLDYFAFTNSVPLPPMAAIPSSGSDFPDGVAMEIPPGPRARFRKPGYYRLGTKSGRFLLGFMVAEPYFPWVSRPAELADPLVYISTREERKNLLEAADPKLAVDQFWLGIHSQKDLARKLIARYYDNIEEANRLFTTHKPGWKTDQGMVMAIYGPPPFVYRSGDTEIWQYDKTMGSENTVFYFSPRAAEKNPHVWELKRYNEYDRVWYGVVELWRKGVINR
jgi:GWxTD domain-containing protein